MSIQGFTRIFNLYLCIHEHDTDTHIEKERYTEGQWLEKNL